MSPQACIPLANPLYDPWRRMSIGMQRNCDINNLGARQLSELALNFNKLTHCIKCYFSHLQRICESEAVILRRQKRCLTVFRCNCTLPCQASTTAVLNAEK